MAAKPAAARTRTWGLRLTVFLSAVQAGRLTGKYEGRGLPRPSRQAVKSGLAAADLDVGSRAGLVVEDRRRRRVHDAVRRRVGDRDLDVLDPGVVRALKLRQRRARVARGVVGVERLHSRHCSADVGLRSGLVRPGAEAQVRGIAIASRIPRMMMTTNSSMRVKPSSRRSRFESLSSITLVLLERVRRWPAASIGSAAAACAPPEKVIPERREDRFAVTLK